MTDETFLPPGSEEARQSGCKCPIYDNCRGAGYFGDGKKYGWVQTADCPLHGFDYDEAIAKQNS